MMAKEFKSGEMTVEKEDLINVFLDNGANQLEDQVFLSKKKLLNAQKGKNELFEMLKMKLKGLDMLHCVLINNKDLIQSNDMLCVETLLNLLNTAKNDKTLYAPITKK